MANANDLRRVLRSSFRYEFDSQGVLTLTHYYTGQEIKLDLSQMTDEMFEELVVEDEDDEEEED